MGVCRNWYTGSVEVAVLYEHEGSSPFTFTIITPDDEIGSHAPSEGCVPSGA